jgi:hypothetical protein
MSAPTAPEPDSTPADADVLLAMAAEERGRADEVASFFEDIATNGLPAVEDCRPWAEVREDHLRDLAARDDVRHVA